MNNFLSLLQFSDGLFPAGAYAHSFGLEYLVQSGEISGATGVEDFLREYLEGTVAPTDAVAVLCALQLIRQRTKLGRALRATTQNPVASRLLGVKLPMGVSSGARPRSRHCSTIVAVTSCVSPSK